MKKISCVIMDWAGTAVDFGCFAPLNAFLKVFSEEKGIDITYRQAREPMGLLKIDHIKAILNMPEVKAKFQVRYNRDWNMDDVNEMYRSFEKHLFSSLRNFTDPIPGVLDTMKLLREEGIRIGSTTGYTQAMMEVVRPDAAAKGYVVDNLVTPDDVPAGRPAPYMIYKNMIDLAIPSVDNVVKVGDTIADIKEGVNAKVWSIGIVTGSNEMGLTEDELQPLVDSWRSANPNIVQFWWAVDRCVKKNISTQKHTVFIFYYKSGMLFIELPSGRRLSYVKPKMGVNKFGSESVVYEGIGGTKKWEQIESYGPKFMENIVQAISRDILAYAMRTLSHCFICGHVHDELIIECTKDVSLDAICEQMGRTPSWIPGLLLRADGYECDFYKKD